MRLRIAILCTLLILSLGANFSLGKVALADSPHFKKGGTDGVSGGGWLSKQQLDRGKSHPHGHRHHPSDPATARHHDLHLHRIEQEWAVEPGHAHLLTTQEQRGALNRRPLLSCCQPRC